MDQDEVMNGRSVEPLLEMEASVRATCLMIASGNPLQRSAQAGLLLLFRPDLVIAQLPHENFLIYGTAGVIEHR